MADTTFRTVFPNLKAVDNGDGTYSMAVSITSGIGVSGASAWVVASDAPAKMRAFAAILQASGDPVWVCDGTADNVQINAAILSVLADGGGTVDLSMGTFDIVKAILPKTRVNLRGCGQATRFDATSFNIADGHGVITVAGVTDLSIRDLVIDGGCAAGGALFGILYDPGAERILTERVEVNGARDDGFAVSGAANDIIIRDCIAHDIANLDYPGTRSGFEVDGDGCKRILVEGCESYNNGCGMSVHTHTDDTVGVKGVRIIGCNFHNNGVNTQDGHKYELRIIAGSTIANLVTEVTAIGNHLKDGVNGCYISGAPNTIFKANTITGMSGYGITGEPTWASGIIIEDNILDTITGAGITTTVALAGAPGVSVIRVRGNVLSNITGARYTLANGTDAYDSYEDIFMDILAASATHIRSNEDLSAATPITFTLSAQPDVPRTIVWAFDSHAQITAYTLVIVGVDARGISHTETFTAASGWSGETAYAYLVVTSITMTARTGTGVGDTMDIGIGSKVGTKGRIEAVDKIKKNNAHMAAASYTVDTTYNTIDLSTGGAIVAGDDFTVWFRQLENR